MLVENELNSVQRAQKNRRVLPVKRTISVASAGPSAVVIKKKGVERAKRTPKNIAKDELPFPLD